MNTAAPTTALTVESLARLMRQCAASAREPQATRASGERDAALQGKMEMLDQIRMALVMEGMAIPADLEAASSEMGEALDCLADAQSAAA